MKVIALIPARFAATRFPGKLMKVLNGKTILQRTYEAVTQTNLFDEVIVVCDDQRLIDHMHVIGGKAVLSVNEHESGTDRIAEAAIDIEADVIINIQGDEPFISTESLVKVIDLFQDETVQVASLMLPIEEDEKINNPNCVKVVVDKKMRALYFSRSPIPYFRDDSFPKSAYQHIGVYGFRKEVLLAFSKLPVSDLERIEKLENLRMLENGISVHLAVIDHVGISIDTEEDFLKAKAYLDAKGE